MERAHSEPSAGGINPFYSAKVKEKIRLVQARPDTLPEAVSPIEPLPGRSEGSIGKGRGSSSMGTSAKGVGGTFVTPPSRRASHGLATNLELGKQYERPGVQTDGPMPPMDVESQPNWGSAWSKGWG